jgi:hypothetical protein
MDIPSIVNRQTARAEVPKYHERRLAELTCVTIDGPDPAFRCGDGGATRRTGMPSG